MVVGCIGAFAILRAAFDRDRPDFGSQAPSTAGHFCLKRTLPPCQCPFWSQTQGSQVSARLPAVQPPP